MLGSSFLRPLARAGAAAAYAATFAAAVVATPAVTHAQKARQATLKFVGAATSNHYAGYAVGPLSGVASFAPTPSMPGQNLAVTLLCVDFLHAVRPGDTYTVNISGITTDPRALALTRHEDGMDGYRRAVWLADQFSTQPATSWGGIQSAIWKIFGAPGLDGNPKKSRGVAVANDPRNEVYWSGQAGAFATSSVYGTYDYSRYAIYTDVDAARKGSHQEFLGPAVAAVVPEPGTLALVGAGAAGVVAWRRRRRGA